MAHDPEILHSIEAWEGSQSFPGFLKSLLIVCNNLLFRPVDFFKRLGLRGNVDLRRRLVRAVIFALILGYIKLFFDIANIYWIKYLSKDVFPPALEFQSSFLSKIFLSAPLFLFRPVITLVLTLGLVGMGVKLALGFDKPWVPALLVVCYKSAADIFYCIPIVGGIFAAVWSLALIVLGIREMYGINFLRSFVSSIIMPLLVLFFFVLSIGPSLNKFLFNLYPEAHTQLARLNDMTAYLYTQEIVSAAQKYKQELGFYPVGLGPLKKYLSSDIDENLTRSDQASGYAYQYRRPDDDHFVLEVKPLNMNFSGRFVFYADESGKVHRDNRGGALIEDAKAMEALSSASQERPQ